MDTNRRTPGYIYELKPNEVFVFGSNIRGEHLSGAADMAYKQFGAVWGKGVGPQGQSYAIPTMNIDINVIKRYVDDFITYAKLHPELFFYVTKIGCGIADLKPEEVAPLFKEAVPLCNIALPTEFWCILNIEYDVDYDGNIIPHHDSSDNNHQSAESKSDKHKAWKVIKIILLVILAIGGLFLISQSILFLLLFAVIGVSFAREVF